MKTHDWNSTFAANRSGWAKANPKVRDWVLANREALDLWREGTTRPGGVAEDLATFERECEAARQAASAVSDLDVMSRNPGRSGEHFSARWIITHMIEEYARHNGHADLLRERIDGATGD